MNSGSYFISGISNFHFAKEIAKDIDSDQGKENTTSFSFTPKMGYFLKNRICIGVLTNITLSGSKISDFDYKNTDTEWYIGPFGRYYLEYGKITPFAELSAAFGGQTSKFETTDGTSKTTHSLLRAAGGIGANYFLNESIAFEAILEYIYNKRKPTSEGATGSGHLDSGISFSIGVVVYFGKI